MKFKGTKKGGGWIVEKADYMGCTNVLFGKEEWDGYIELWHHHNSKTESEANAKLIANAPKLLNLLIDFVEDFDKGLIEDFQMPRDTFELLIKEITDET